MEPTLVLFLFSLAMFIGCYIAGSIPLAVSLSEDRMEVVTVFGAGLLIGTALTVIIPEGVNILVLSNQKHSHGVQATEGSTTHEHKDEDALLQMHNLIGLSLVLGFLLMFIIDQCAGSHHKQDAESSLSRTGRAPWMATLGLVVHAAADGIALGAAVASSHTDVEIIVFFAIMLHKAPAAFGLVTFLMHERLEMRRIRRHLLLFAVAAPIGAILIYVVITQSGSATLSSSRSAGVAMLFSAGTFVYVSTVHVLPEITSHSAPQTPSVGSTSEGGKHGFSRRQVVAIVAGCLSPLFLTLGHHH